MWGFNSRDFVSPILGLVVVAMLTAIVLWEGIPWVWRVLKPLIHQLTA